MKKNRLPIMRIPIKMKKVISRVSHKKEMFILSSRTKLMKTKNITKKKTNRNRSHRRKRKKTRSM